MAYTVRRFKETDAAEVSALIIKTLRTVNIKDYSSEYIENDVSFLQPDNILIRNTWQHIYIVQDGNVIVGCGAIGPYYDKLDEASLFTIFVLPEYHGRGIGRMIIETLEKDELFLRSKRIEIPSSITARDFYIKMGYDYKDGITDVDEEQLYKLEKFRPIYFLDSVDSTNIVAKKYAGEGATHGTVVIADSQTAGRGRLGRSFMSPAGSGLYMSIVLRPFEETAKRKMRFNPSLVTVVAGVAVIRALKTICDIDAEIKWVNDILVNGKKLCGILAEGMMNTCSGSLDAIILGIGINLKSPENGYPEELRNIVTNIEEILSHKSHEHMMMCIELRNRLAFEITSNVLALLSGEVSDEELISEYRAHCSTIGQDIFVYKKGLDGDATPAKAIDIDKDGGLIVQYESTDPDNPGITETLTFGEISIRPAACTQK